ncbi:response regulator [Pseudomonas frederiksbergensis]|uniref:response regulator n=1 Tax=Pseudomonas frederiksbergensis TaxID=104087 RepID=UPI000F4686EA|nr:response regulator [Pseudomonas frederiksbergensis]
MKETWEKLLPLSGWTLVVEDDPMLRILMVTILAEIGIRSVDFDSADDALTYLLGTPNGCPLLVVDHGLPGQLSGAEFIEMVKSKWPSTAAVLTSGYELAHSTIPSSTTYLHKPWSMDELVTAVASLLQPGDPISKI